MNIGSLEQDLLGPLALGCNLNFQRRSLPSVYHGLRVDRAYCLQPRHPVIADLVSSSKSSIPLYTTM